VIGATLTLPLSLRAKLRAKGKKRERGPGAKKQVTLEFWLSGKCAVIMLRERGKKRMLWGSDPVLKT